MSHIDWGNTVGLIRWRNCKGQNAAGKNVQRPWVFAKQPDGQRPHRTGGRARHSGLWTQGAPQGCLCLSDPSSFQWAASSSARLRELLEPPWAGSLSFCVAILGWVDMPLGISWRIHQSPCSLTLDPAMCLQHLHPTPRGGWTTFREAPFSLSLASPTEVDSSEGAQDGHPLREQRPERPIYISTPTNSFLLDLH